MMFSFLKKKRIEEASESRTIAFEKIDHIFDIAKKSLDKVDEHLTVLNIVTNSIDAMIWLKKYDYINKKHVYIYANKALCDGLFQLYHLTHAEQLEYIKNQSDLDIIADYRMRTKKRHSYGELCLGTDDFCTNHNQLRIKQGLKPESMSFLEMGIIDGKPLILKVTKKALFKDIPPCDGCKGCVFPKGHYCSTAGSAIDITDNFKGEMELIRVYENRGIAQKLGEGIYWIKKEREFEWALMENS